MFLALVGTDCTSTFKAVFGLAVCTALLVILQIALNRPE